MSFYCLEVSLAGELGPIEGWPAFLRVTDQILRLTKILITQGQPQPGHDENVGRTGLAEQLRPSVLAVSRCFPGPTRNLSRSPNLLPHAQSAQGLQVGLLSALDSPRYKHVYNSDTNNRRTQGLPGSTNPSSCLR